LLPGISTLSIQEGKKRTIEKREIDNGELFTFHRSSDQLCGISAHIFAVKEKKKGPKKKVKIENGKKNKPQKQKPWCWCQYWYWRWKDRDLMQTINVVEKICKRGKSNKKSKKGGKEVE
jgi:hypothetical protein